MWRLWGKCGCVWGGLCAIHVDLGVAHLLLNLVLSFPLASMGALAVSLTGLLIRTPSPLPSHRPGRTADPDHRSGDRARTSHQPGIRTSRGQHHAAPTQVRTYTVLYCSVLILNGEWETSLLVMADVLELLTRDKLMSCSYKATHVWECAISA